MNESLVELREVLARRADALDDLADAASTVSESIRLNGKAEGVNLAIAFVDEQLRREANG